MTSEPSDADQRQDPRQAPFLIAILGAVAVALALFLPISVPDPSGPDGATVDCGNAAFFNTDWINLNDSWRTKAHDACTDERLTRLAEAAGAVSLALVAATLLLALPQRRRAEQTQTST